MNTYKVILSDGSTWVHVMYRAMAEAVAKRYNDGDGMRNGLIASVLTVGNANE